MLKLRVLTLVAFLAMVVSSVSVTAQAQAANECSLKLHIDGFRNQKGDAGVTVFRSPDGWPEDNDKSFLSDTFPITGKDVTVTVKVPAGKYAVGVLHDENSNHKVDRNILQLPKEGFGFSNNPKVWLTAPSFHTSLVQISCPVTSLDIHLIYK